MQSSSEISRRYFAVVLMFAMATISAFAGKSFVMPVAQAAKTYPAHDEHPEELVTVALDPYDVPDKAKLFSVKYQEAGYLPVLMVVTNDGDQPVSLTGMKAQFVTADRTKISPATEDDLYRRLAHPHRSTTPLPLPYPTTKVKGGLSRDALDEIQNSLFAARAVEPHSTQAGFLFIDISGISTPLAGAHFYLTGVRDGKGDEMMYFEVPLEKYLNAASKP